uniref:Metallothionein n=1 Tax=Ostrea edulis TaxID=37623 RepID=Q8WQ16_OSTED|nr:metallothionein [Ostrea edulis]
MSDPCNCQKRNCQCSGICPSTGCNCASGCKCVAGCKCPGCKIVNTVASFCAYGIECIRPVTCKCAAGCTCK